MKKLLLFTAVITFSLSTIAQGKSQKKENTKTNNDNNKTQRSSHVIVKSNSHGDVYHAPQSNTADYSKNTPTKAREAFTRDYPNATNVTWTKNRGYWTASFPNGFYRTSVTYSANGQRTNTSRRRLR